MILIRDIFHLKFGRAKDAKELLESAKDLNRKFGFDKSRALTDLVTSRSYTLVFESEWESLSEWESASKKGLESEEWQKWYGKFVPLVETASREILNIVK